jgi:hypothetical protein
VYYIIRIKLFNYAHYGGSARYVANLPNSRLMATSGEKVCGLCLVLADVRCVHQKNAVEFMNVEGCK